jgi:hypothetical protein
MSCFKGRALRVRDSGLVYGRRVAALCSCVRWYHPIGHRATLSFLASVTGPYQRHERALLRALDLLEASHTVWLSELRAYATRRKEEKQNGRSRDRDDRQPVMDGGHWYETRTDISRRAALHALKLWEQEHETADPVVRTLVRECVATAGRLPAGRLAEIRSEAWPLPLVASATGMRQPVSLISMNFAPVNRR